MVVIDIGSGSRGFSLGAASSENQICYNCDTFILSQGFVRNKHG
jgi:hypothetical protein